MSYQHPNKVNTMNSINAPQNKSDHSISMMEMANVFLREEECRGGMMFLPPNGQMGDLYLCEAIGSNSKSKSKSKSNSNIKSTTSTDQPQCAHSNDFIPMLNVWPTGNNQDLEPTPIGDNIQIVEQWLMHLVPENIASAFLWNDVLPPQQQQRQQPQNMVGSTSQGLYSSNNTDNTNNQSTMYASYQPLYNNKAANNGYAMQSATSNNLLPFETQNSINCEPIKSTDDLCSVLDLCRDALGSIDMDLLLAPPTATNNSNQQPRQGTACAVTSSSSSSSFLSLQVSNNAPPSRRASKVAASCTASKPSTPRPRNTQQWYKKFQQLVQYKRTHGHCHVSSGDANYKVLAHWVRRQRHQHRLKLEGRPSCLADERMDALEELGFTWNPHTAAWEERFQELVQYKDAVGDCRVPRPYPQNPSLSIWVKCQRRQYQLLLAGSKTALTQERLERLNMVGFVWNIRGGTF